MSTHHPSWVGGAPFVDGLPCCIWLCVLLRKSTVAAVSHYGCCFPLHYVQSTLQLQEASYMASYNYSWGSVCLMMSYRPHKCHFLLGIVISSWQMSQNIAMELRPDRGHRFLWPGRIYPNSRQHGVCCWVVNSFVHFPKPPENLTCLGDLFWG